jgi:rhodanese-related sulfurtransferase
VPLSGSGWGGRLSWLATLLAVSLWAVQAQEVAIESLSRNGVLAWTNNTLGVACRVEWAPTVEGPWAASWEQLTDIRITNHVTAHAVPMFYRVFSYPAPTPTVSEVTAQGALALVQGHPADPNFIVLDVRAPSEYTAGHIKTCLNVNFFSAAFEETLAKLDRKKTYLVYCASGNRSRQASEAMRRLQFLHINNMTQGFSTFAALPGADAYVER